MNDSTVTDIHTARILVVDDEEINLLLLKRIFEKNGYSEVRFVVSGKDIEALVRDVDTHLLLLDFHMPASDGFEILKCHCRDEANGFTAWSARPHSADYRPCLLSVPVLTGDNSP